MNLRKLILKLHEQINTKKLKLWNGEDDSLSQRDREAIFPKLEKFNNILYLNYLHILTKDGGYYFSKERLKLHKEYSLATHCTQEEITTMFCEAGAYIEENINVVNCVSLSALAFKLAHDPRIQNNLPSLKIDIISMMAWPHFLMRFSDTSTNEALYYDPWVLLQPNVFGPQPLTIPEDGIEAHLRHLVTVKIASKCPSPYARFTKSESLYDLEKDQAYNPNFSDDNVNLIVAHSTHPDSRPLLFQPIPLRSQSMLGFFSGRSNTLQQATLLAGLMLFAISLLKRDDGALDLLRFALCLTLTAGLGIILSSFYSTKAPESDKRMSPV